MLQACVRLMGSFTGLEYVEVPLQRKPSQKAANGCAPYTMLFALLLHLGEIPNQFKVVNETYLREFMAYEVLAKNKVPTSIQVDIIIIPQFIIHNKKLN